MYTCRCQSCEPHKTDHSPLGPSGCCYLCTNLYDHKVRFYLNMISMDPPLKMIVGATIAMAFRIDFIRRHPSVYMIYMSLLDSNSMWRHLMQIY